MRGHAYHCIKVYSPFLLFLWFVETGEDLHQFGSFCHVYCVQQAYVCGVCVEGRDLRKKDLGEILIKYFFCFERHWTGIIIKI